MKKFFFLFTMLTVFALSSVADTWTVAGNSSALFGETWNPSYTANDMTLVDGLYTWTKSGAELATGNVEFKVCKNHAWDEAWGKDNSTADNYVLAVPETATYDATITFNATTKDITATLTKTGTAEITIDYYLVGETAGWGNNENYKFAEDNGVYTLKTVFSGAFKIHTSTDVWYSNGQAITATNNTVELNQNTDNNMTIAAQDDPYTLTIENGVLTITGFSGSGSVTHTYKLQGTYDNWNSQQGYDLAELATGGYGAEVTLTGDYTFKVVKDGTWLGNGNTNMTITKDGEYELSTGGTDGNFTIAAGTYTFAVDADATKLTVTGFPEPEPAFALVGTFNEWNIDNAIQLVKQEDGSYVAENVAMSAGDEFLVYEKSANAYLGPEAALTLSYDVPGANLVPSVYEANFKVESDVTLKVKVAVNESNQLYIHTEGWPEPQPEVLYYRIVGGFDNWDNPTVYDLTLNSETGYYESDADLAIAKGFNFKFNIYSDKGTSVWYGGNTDGDHWFDIMAEQFGNAISISESGTNIYFMKDATGVKFAVKADFSELIISGAYVPTVTLAEALAGAQAGVISDELTVVRVTDEFVYVTNGTDYLRLAGVDNAAELEPGHVIAAEQIAVPVANPATNPTATVDGAVNATAGENVPAVAELNLRDGITTMPKPAQIVKITGYYVVEDGTPKFSAYSGKHGGNGNTIILNDAAGMEVDAEYTIEAAIELAEPWDKTTVTDVDSNAGIGFGGGGGSTVNPRIKASDKDAVSNLKLMVVGTPTATGVADLTTDKPVAGIQYVNVAGQVSAEPFDGINIVVTTYVDGTRSAVKVVK